MRALTNQNATTTELFQNGMASQVRSASAQHMLAFIVRHGLQQQVRDAVGSGWHMRARKTSENNRGNDGGLLLDLLLQDILVFKAASPELYVSRGEWCVRLWDPGRASVHRSATGRTHGRRAPPEHDDHGHAFRNAGAFEREGCQGLLPLRLNEVLGF